MLSDQELQKFHYDSYGARNRIELNVPGCECSVTYSPNSRYECQCKLPPCAISAFKHLQVQQQAYKSNISTLETTVEHIQMAMSKFRSTAELTTEISLTSHMQSGALQDDVREWLAGKTRSATKV